MKAKKLLALTLALVMALSGTSLSALATGESAVAMIGDEEYGSLAEAVAAVPTTGVETIITMVADETIIGNAGVTIAATKNVVLDLNGFTITELVTEDKAAQVIANNGTLTIQDSSEKKTGTITNAADDGVHVGEWWSTPQYNYATNTIKNSGTLNVTDGTILNTAAGSICYAVDNNSTSANTVLNLSGGRIAKNGTPVRLFCNSTTYENVLNMTGGEIEGNYTAFWVQLPGAARQAKKATLNISGGAVTGNSYAFYDYSYGDVYDAVSYTISGGVFDGCLYSYEMDDFVSGGIFSEDPSDYVVPAKTVRIITAGQYTDWYEVVDRPTAGEETTGDAIETAEDGHTYAATATGSVITSEGADYGKTAYAIDVTVDDAAAPTATVNAMTTLSPNDITAATSGKTEVLDDTVLAALIASAVAKAGATDDTAAQSAVDAVDAGTLSFRIDVSDEIEDAPTGVSETLAAAIADVDTRVFDAVPKLIAKDGDDNVIAETELDNKYLSGSYEITLELGESAADKLVTITHFGAVPEDDETFTVIADEDGNVTFSVTHFSYFGAVTNDGVAVAQITDGGSTYYYTTYQAAFNDGANNGTTVQLLMPGFIDCTIPDGTTLTVKYTDKDDPDVVIQGPETMIVSAVGASYIIQVEDDEDGAVVFQSIAFGTHSFEPDADVTKTLKNGSAAVEFIMNYSTDTSYSNTQYIELPITLNSSAAGESYKGVTLYAADGQPVTVDSFTPASGVTLVPTAEQVLATGKVALVPTAPDGEFGFGSLLGTLKLKVRENTTFNTATGSFTLTADIAADRNLLDTADTVTGTYTFDIGYLVTLNAVMDDTLANAEQYVSAMTLDGAAATLAAESPFGATVSQYFKAGATGIAVTGTAVADKYQLQDDAGALLTKDSTDRDTDNTDAIAFTAPSTGNETLTLHFEAQEYEVTFATNEPDATDGTGNGYPFTTENTVTTQPSPAVAQAVKYNVTTTLNGTAAAPLNTFTLEGWIFDGWTDGANNYSAASHGTTTGDNFTLDTPAAKTMYAKWNPMGYTLLAKNADDWSGTFAPTELAFGENYIGTSAIKDYNTTLYEYKVTVSDGTNEFEATVTTTGADAGKISFTAAQVAGANMEPGSTLTVSALKRVANVTVEAYPLANNVVLVRAYSPSNAALRYYDREMLYDERFETVAVSGVDCYSNVMLLDVTMDGIAGTTMNDIETAVMASDRFSANEWVDNRTTITAMNTATPGIAKGNYNVNGVGGATPDIVDISLVYNVYKGAYSYAADPAMGGQLRVHDTQYLLSDVSFAGGADMPNDLTGVPGSFGTQNQLVNMDDVKLEYTQAYGG